jgi:hypothetical protein
MHSHLLGWIVIGLIGGWINGVVMSDALHKRIRSNWQMGFRGEGSIRIFSVGLRLHFRAAGTKD